MAHLGVPGAVVSPCMAQLTDEREGWQDQAGARQAMSERGEVRAGKQGPLGQRKANVRNLQMYKYPSPAFCPGKRLRDWLSRVQLVPATSRAKVDQTCFPLLLVAGSRGHDIQAAIEAQLACDLPKNKCRRAVSSASCHCGT